MWVASTQATTNRKCARARAFVAGASRHPAGQKTGEEVRKAADATARAIAPQRVRFSHFAVRPSAASLAATAKVNEDRAGAPRRPKNDSLACHSPRAAALPPIRFPPPRPPTRTTIPTKRRRTATCGATQESIFEGKPPAYGGDAPDSSLWRLSWREVHGIRDEQTLGIAQREVARLSKSGRGSATSRMSRTTCDTALIALACVAGCGWQK